QRGTGDAVRSALPELDPSARAAFLLYGDTPLIHAHELARLEQALAQGGPLALLTTTLDDATGYGRILRDTSGKVVAIREHRDCSADERTIREVNPGVYLAEAAFLREAIAGLRPDNAQKELYLTDIVAAASKLGGAVGIVCPDPGSLVGINDRAQLAA